MNFSRTLRHTAAAWEIILLFAGLAFAYSPAGLAAPAKRIALAPQRRAQTTRRRSVPRVSQAPRINYSKFSHRTQPHQQECNSCHKFPSKNWKDVRKGPEGFADITDYPEHSSCLTCHTQQFFARERPAPRICSVCHVAVTPRNSERHPFPNPPEIFNASKQSQSFVSDFRIQFPHETHLELVGMNEAPDRTEAGHRLQRASFGPTAAAQDTDKSCAFCHQTYQPQGKSDDEFVSARPKGFPDDGFWLKKGTFKTIPNHATCFTCHTPGGDMKPASNECAACHKLAPTGPTAHVDFDPKLATVMGVTDGNVLSRWRTRYSSGTFRHEGGMHPEQGCATCHKVSAINALDVATLKVPITACDLCHIAENADEGAALNFETDKRKADPTFKCTKCHIAFAKEPVPASHVNAIPKAKAK